MVRRLLARAGLVFVVGTLAVVALPVAEASAAGADTLSVIADVAGKVAAAAPAALEAGATSEAGVASSALCSSGIGCVVFGAVVLGSVAYATKDLWLPYAEQGISHAFPDTGGPSNWVLSVDSWPTQPATASDTSCSSTPTTVRMNNAADYPTTEPPSCGSAWMTLDCLSCHNWTGYSGYASPSWVAQPNSNFAEISQTVCRPVEGGQDVVFGQEGSTGNFTAQPDNNGTTMRMQLPACGLYYGGNASWHTDQGGGSWDPGKHYVPIKMTVWAPGNGASFHWVSPWLTSMWSTQTRAVSKCVRPDGTTYDSPGVVDDPLHAGAVQVPLCNPGDTIQSFETQTSPTGATGSWVGTGVHSLSGLKADDPAYPQCAGASCLYQIFVDHQACVATTSTSACANWSVISTADPARVECHYGPYVLDVARCAFMERAYDLQAAPATAPNIDGDPRTSTGPAPTPDPGGYPAPAPATPTPTGTSSPTVTASAPADPTPTPVPTPGGGGTPPANDPAGNECWPTGYSAFNPSQWVLMPVKCAMAWAFIPKGGFTPYFDQAKAAGGASPLGRWWGLFSIWSAGFGVLGVGSGCQGPPVPTGVLGDKGVLPAVIYPFDACSGVKATAAATSRIVLSVMIGWGSGWKLVRIVGAPFGYSVRLMNDEK